MKISVLKREVFSYLVGDKHNIPECFYYLCTHTKITRLRRVHDKEGEMKPRISV
jgi:hypothetical protein